MPWYDLVLLVLASFRLTHLLVFDVITEPLRRPLLGRPFIGTLISCYWCTGIWVSAGLVAGLAFWPSVVRWILLVLAVAGAQSFLESRLDRE